MNWIARAPLDTVYRRRENDGEPVNDRRLRALIEAGRIVRVARGSFVESSAWNALTPIARHAQRVWEASARLQRGQVFSHFAAAALHGIDILGPWPDAIDVSIASSSGGRSSGGVRRHSRELGAVASVAWGEHAVTTPLQTTVDLIAAMRFTDAVAVADQALWARRPGGAVVARPALLAAAADRQGRGAARAVRAAEFSTDLADSVRESQSRVLIAAQGFPAPELQTCFRLSTGSDAYVDFFWRDHRHIGEFDGAGKYLDPALRGGRAPEHALLVEKDREDDLRRQVAAFSRWRTPALTRPQRLYDILRSAGLPTARPRPGR